MNREAQTTTSHDEIRRWAEERGGEPASVRDTEAGGEPGVLRIAFRAEQAEPALERISWESLFEKFEREKLAFLYQEKTRDGAQSRFFKFVQRDA
ncbi:hypothetical protein BH24PSE2_BH24PSE2_10900 [soil metagenome]